MPTPLPSGAKESKIEDFFDSDTKKNIIPGKAFNSANEIDRTKEYGKKDFAQAVKRKAKSVNFDGFQPLLSVFSSVITAHAESKEEVETSDAVRN